ncbi:MAG: carboxymuconolactone decarboxylase family protein [Acidimicrobiaceae bacterium]|nr:carboxymuconolactone decarboxylase family protein [Acidimicrobiaceae bacterium]
MTEVDHLSHVNVDVSKMPRLGKAPVPEGAEQAESYGLRRHPSMRDLARHTLMWNPEMLEAHGVFTGYLRNSTCLPRRDREIAILRHAWDCGSDYQWALHSKMAADAGLTDSEVERLATTAADDRWAPHEAAIIRAVDELHALCRIGDETWEALSAHYDERQIIELLALVGSYRLLAYMFNAVGIRPPDGHSPDLPGNSFLFVDRRS